MRLLHLLLAIVLLVVNPAISFADASADATAADSDARAAAGMLSWERCVSHRWRYHAPENEKLARARERKAGLWSDADAVAPWELE